METGYDQLLKVMFANNEEKTRKLLRVLVDWQSIGYEPAEDAVNANQAMELIEEEHPDVVITDIEMPYIDNLELAQMLAEEYPQIMVIVLTTYDLFQCVQKSVELGIKNFLLKPIRRAGLTEIMKDVRTDIMEEHGVIFEFKGLESRIAELRALIVQNFLNNLFLNKVGQESLWDIIRYYDIPLRRDTGYYSVVVLMPKKHNDPEEDELRKQRCMEVLSPAISRLTDVLLLKDVHQNLILLSQNRKISLMSYGAHFTVPIKGKLSMGIYTGCGNPVDFLEEIRYSYKQAHKSAMIADYSHNQALLSSDGKPDMEDLQELIQTLAEELSLYLGIPPGDKVRQLVGTACGIFKGLPQSSLSDYLVISYSIVNVTLSTPSDNGIPYIEIYSADHLSYGKILRLTRTEEIEKYISQSTNFMICQIEEYMNKKNTTLVHRVVQCMNKHMDDSILLLAKIPKINHVNNSYLSGTFKCVMGINFTDYLVSIRIGATKRLLGGTDLRIYEMARNVDIEDLNYFSKFFKKHIQETPARYRDRCQGTLQAPFLLHL